MEILGLIGILIALILFIFLVYKNCVSYWAVMICVAIVALTNQLNLLEALTVTFTGGLMDLFLQMFSIVFGGAILGKLFTDVGAANSIASALIKQFLPKEDTKNKVFLAVLVLFIFNGICTMGGIDGYVGIFTMFPIYMLVCKKCDIPRRFLPGMMFLNCMFMAAPGAPQIHNVMAVAAMNSASAAALEEGGTPFFVNATAGLIPGWICVVLIASMALFYMPRAIRKAQAKGEHFDAGFCEMMERETGQMPHWLISLLPLIAVFACYSILHLDIFWALMVGIAITVIFMGKYLPKQDFRGNRIHFLQSLVQSLNMGANQYPNAMLNVITPSGLAAVITSTAAFGLVIGMFYGMAAAIPLAAVALIATCVIVGITSSPPAALMIVIPNIIVPIALKAGADMGINAAIITRIAAIAASTFESLPFNGMCVMLMGVSHCTIKESYKPMGVISVGFTLIGAIVCTILAILAPGIFAIG